MAFPSSPTNGQLATVNGIIYQYGSSTRSWTRVVGSIGNLTTSNLSVIVNSTIGSNQTILGNLYIGSTANATPFTNPILIGVDSGAGYVQAAIINTFGNASADFTAYSNNGNDVQGWMDMGMTGNVFNDSKYTITGYNDGYIFANGVTGNSSLGGNLVIATGSGGSTNDIVFATGGFLAANEKMRFSNATSLFRIYGNLTANNATVTANLTTGNIFSNSYYFANGTPFSSGSPAGGSNTYVQFNDGGTSFGGNANFTYNKTTSQLLLRNNNVITNYTGNTAPTNPKQGDEWYYRPTDTLYKYIYDGGTYNWVSISSALYTANTGAVANTLALRDSGGNLTATNFLGIASSAKYADLAENYLSDNLYEAGTVVVFGGEAEITTSNQSHDTRVAGVISTNPAYLMNSECNGLPVAFTGRVPCFVKGPVNKGDLLVTSDQPGVAQALNNNEYKPGCVFGKSLGTIDNTTITTIEVVVGRY